MRLYRCVRSADAATAFSGEGSGLYGGRWNSVGTPIVYTSSALSLCLLEVFINASVSSLPANMVYFEIDVPDKIQVSRLQVETLPNGWGDYPAPNECQRLGDQWFQGQESVGLQVPSALTPVEYNVLLNPRHSNFTKIAISDVMPLRVDRRLRER